MVMRCWLSGLCLALLSGSAWAGEPALQRLEANMGPGCHIAISFPARLKARLGGGGDTEGGSGGFTIRTLPESWRTSLEDLYVGLICENLDIERFSFQVRLNPDTGQWEKDLDDLLDSSDKVRRAYDASIRVDNLTAVNSTGYVMTQDEFMGLDEEWRQRWVSFCLSHPPKTLCGRGVVANLRELPRGDLTPHVLDILRSIEFLPNAPTDQSPDQP